MKSSILKFALAGVSLILASAAFAQAPQPPAPAKPGPAPNPNARDNVTGAFEGWFKNPDGTFSLLLGYFNRNAKQVFDIPIGPDNKIEPGGPDRGQPTHFLLGRQWGMFAIKVPANFGQNKVTWTLTANGKTAVIPASLLPDYEISPFKEEAVGNTPPILSFEEMGPSVQGPVGMTISKTTTVANPLSLTVFGSDDGKWTTLSGARPGNIAIPVRVHWVQYRGPAAVTFEPDRPSVEKIEPSSGPHAHQTFTGKATTSAKFSAPGNYVLHVIMNDLSGEGGGGEQCCWTFGDVKVSVKP